MAKIKQPRMAKGSKLRKAANKALPKLLAQHGAKVTTAARLAKRPAPPRLVQRTRRLEALAAQKKQLAERQKTVLARLGLSSAA